MASVDLLWTVLPRFESGERSGLAVVDVLVGFRFSDAAGQTMGDFADVFGNFTDTLFDPDVDWSVVVRAGGRGATEHEVGATLRPPELDPELFDAAFPSDTPVRSHGNLNRWSTRKVRSFPAINVAQAVTSAQFGIAAVAVDDLPPINQIGEFQSFTEYRVAEHIRLLEPRELVLAQQLAVPPAPSDPTVDLLEAERFLKRPHVEARTERPDPPVLDTAARLSLLGQQPLVMRRMGLLFQLELALAPEEIAALLDTGVLDPFGPRLRIGAVPVFRSNRLDPTPDVPREDEVVVPRSAVRDLRPWTRSVITRDRFEVAPRADGDHRDGFLKLDDGNHDTVTFDHLAAATQAQHYARSVALERAQRAEGLRRRTPSAIRAQRLSPPVLRSASIAVVRTGAAAGLVAAIRRSADQDAATGTGDFPGDDLLLDLDDVARGVRVDVRQVDADGRPLSSWFSLMRRRVRFELPGHGIVEVDDEGHVMPAPTGNLADDDLYLSETLFEWNGWSLAAPRPGNAIGRGDQVVTSKAEGAAERGVQDLGFARTVLGPVAGSLPMLRFGARYQVRARTVDVTGWSLPFVAEDDDHALTTPYLRYDPVPPPAVLLRDARVAGEQVHRLVVRSPWFDREPDSARSRRHVVPARTAQRMAELHSMFDVVVRGTATIDPDAYQVAAAREAGTYLTLGEPDPGHAGWAGPDAPSAPRIYPSGTLPLVHLPDPMGPGVALRRTNGTNPLGTIFPSFVPGESLNSKASIEDIRESWPDWRTLRLEVVPIESRSPEDERWSYDHGHGIITVELPRGSRSSVRLSSRLLPQDLDLFAQAVVDDTPVRQAFLSGNHWALTPWRDIDLVHAVRQPLDAPGRTGDSEVVDRAVNQTTIRYTGAIRIHGPSTGAVDNRIEWTEHLDNLDEDGPREEIRSANPGRVALSAAAEPDDLDRQIVPIDVRHDFGDTKRRTVTISAIAHTADLEHFRVEVPHTATAGLAVINPVGPDPDAPGKTKGGFTPGTVRVRDAADPKLVFKESAFPGDASADYLVDDTAGAIRFFSGRLASPGQRTPLLTPGSSRAVVISYVDAATTRTATRAPVVFEATARPAAPVVNQVLPTFKWELAFDGSARHRRGGRVRIYLERPWFTSGEDEELGVVVAADRTNVPSALRGLLSQWGADPLHKAPAPSNSYLDGSAFRSGTLRTNPVGPGAFLTLPEAVTEPVHIVSHPVTFDPVRKLWFADVALPASTSYWPMVRLVVCRYQHRAASGAFDLTVNCSATAVCEFTQVAPDRTVEVSGTGSTRRVQLTGRSIEPSAGRLQPLARVTLETREHASDGDLGWIVHRGPLNMNRSTSGNVSTWSTAVNVSAPTGLARRLVIEEVERFRDDGASLQVQGTIGERLVFLDIVNL